MCNEDFDEQLLPFEDLQHQPAQETEDSRTHSIDSSEIRESLVDYCKDNPLQWTSKFVFFLVPV
eukprot:gene1067-404_t